METNFVINDFEGPLDLLLHLIKTSKMSIYDIKIVEITKQYIDFINRMKDLNLTVASEYLVMASELIEIKSKMLLPREQTEVSSDEYEEDPREELVKRLLEYQTYKEITKVLHEKEEERSNYYTKSPENYSNYSDGEVEIKVDYEIDDLINALKSYLARKKDNKPLNTKVTVNEISVSSRRHDIRNILKEKKKINFFELFPIVSKEYIVATFLAVLEMAKSKELIIKQEESFGEIICEVVSNNE